MTKLKAEKSSLRIISLSLIYITGLICYFIYDYVNLILLVFIINLVLIVYAIALYFKAKKSRFKDTDYTVFYRKNTSSDIWITLLISLNIFTLNEWDGKLFWVCLSLLLVAIGSQIVEYINDRVFNIQKLVITSNGILFIDVYEFYYSWDWLQNHGSLVEGKLMIKGNFWQRTKFDLKKFEHFEELVKVFHKQMKIN